MEKETYAGIDVSKKTLEANWGRRKTYPNTLRGIHCLVKRLKREEITLVVVEATGGYERLVVEGLCAGEVPFAVINPIRTKAFATSLGLAAKTDKIDAEMLRLFAERMKPKAQRLPPENVRKLQYFFDRRSQLLDLLIVEKNHLKAPLLCPETKQSVCRIIKILQKELKMLEAKVQATIEASEALSLIANTVQTEKGVGPVLTLALLADMPELGTLNRAEVGALTGVAPLDDQSGFADNSRQIKGGRKRVRHTLYMATVCAIRRNQHLKTFFLGLVKRGKHKMVALIATMRKFIIRLNSLVRTLIQDNPAIAFAFS